MPAPVRARTEPSATSAPRASTAPPISVANIRGQTLDGCEAQSFLGLLQAIAGTGEGRVQVAATLELVLLVGEGVVAVAAGCQLLPTDRNRHRRSRPRPDRVHGGDRLSGRFAVVVDEHLSDAA